MKEVFVFLTTFLCSLLILYFYDLFHLWQSNRTHQESYQENRKDFFTGSRRYEFCQIRRK